MITILFFHFPRNFHESKMNFHEIREPTHDPLKNKHRLIDGDRRAQLTSGQPSRVSAKAVF